MGLRDPKCAVFDIVSTHVVFILGTCLGETLEQARMG